ncbi:MAG: type II toxin-antitoxin system RelE/ParE family toxin [Candidatus Margulisiibacteriota bacterium]
MVVWTLPARDDLKNIYHFIAEDSVYFAVEVSEKIIDISKQLIHFPLQGRQVPELKNAAFREVFVYSYRLIYEIKNQTIYVIALVHMKKKFKGIK